MPIADDDQVRKMTEVSMAMTDLDGQPIAGDRDREALRIWWLETIEGLMDDGWSPVSMSWDNASGNRVRIGPITEDGALVACAVEPTPIAAKRCSDPTCPGCPAEHVSLPGEPDRSRMPAGEVCSTRGCMRTSFHQVPEECRP